MFEKELKVGCVWRRMRGTGRTWTWGEGKNMIKYTILPNFPEVVILYFPLLPTMNEPSSFFPFCVTNSAVVFLQFYLKVMAMFRCSHSIYAMAKITWAYQWGLTLKCCFDDWWVCSWPMAHCFAFCNFKISYCHGYFCPYVLSMYILRSVYPYTQNMLLGVWSKLLGSCRWFWCELQPFLCGALGSNQQSSQSTVWTKIACRRVGVMA